MIALGARRLKKPSQLERQVLVARRIHRPVGGPGQARNRHLDAGDNKGASALHREGVAAAPAGGLAANKDLFSAVIVVR